MSETKKSPELIAQVLEGIAQGKTLTSLCVAYGFSQSAWAKWVAQDHELAKAYYDARSVGADSIADDILDIVDTVKEDTVAVAKARLRADTRLRLLAKWQPDKYGDKVDVRHAGPDGGAVQLAYANVTDLAKQMRMALTGQKPVAEIEDKSGSDLL